MNTEEKINYIYETLKKQESRYKRGIWFKWILRILFLAYIYYFIMFSLPNIIDSIKKSLTPNLKNTINLDTLDINKLKNLIK